MRRRASARLVIAERLTPSERQVTLFWAGVVGFAGALASILFRFGLAGVQRLLTGHGGELVEAAAALVWWRRLITPAVGGLLAGLVLHLGARLSQGQRSMEYLEAITLGSGVIPVRPSLVRSLSSLFTIASGGSIGREGPMVQLAALSGSWIGRAVGLPVQRLRLLVACGAAAGIASAYNAPIGGALFVAELLIGAVAIESFGPLLFASVVASLTVRQILGAAPVYDLPRFQLVSFWEVGAYLVLGLVCGLVGPAFLRILRASRRAFAAAPGPEALTMALGGLVVGALSVYVPEVWGNGYSATSSILTTHWAWSALLVVLVAKVLATAATVGSGGVGGVFTPTLFVGAVVGALLGQAVHALWPAVTAGAQAYAVVGMAGLLAGTTQAPLMAIVMLFEMTLEYDVVLPLMLVCVTAYYVSHEIEPHPVYAVVGRQPSAAPGPNPADLTVADLMREAPPAVEAGAPFAEVVERFLEHPYKYLYVTDGTGRFIGAVSINDVKAHLADESLAGVVVAADLVRPDFPVVAASQSLLEALDRFARHDGERLPVVTDPASRRLVGTLAKTDVLLALSQAARPVVGV